jgi:hypothetical protein
MPGKFETYQIIKLQMMVKALQTKNRQIKTKIRQNIRQDSVNASSVDQFFSCATYGCTDHLTVNYTFEQTNMLNNNFRPQNNPFSNTYNPRWRNHPNFSWRNDQGSKIRIKVTQIKVLDKDSTNLQHNHQSPTLNGCCRILRIRLDRDSDRYK